MILIQAGFRFRAPFHVVGVVICEVEKSHGEGRELLEEGDDAQIPCPVISCEFLSSF